MLVCRRVAAKKHVSMEDVCPTVPSLVADDENLAGN